MLLWSLRCAGLGNVPSVSQVKTYRERLHKTFGISAREVTGSLGHAFTLNSIKDILRDVRLSYLSCMLIFLTYYSTPGMGKPQSAPLGQHLPGGRQGLCMRLSSWKEVARANAIGIINPDGAGCQSRLLHLRAMSFAGRANGYASSMVYRKNQRRS